MVYPDAAVELKAGIPQPPRIEDVFSGVHFGVPDWDAGVRYLRAQPVDLRRWIKELTDAFPPPVVSHFVGAAASARGSRAGPIGVGSGHQRYLPCGSHPHGRQPRHSHPPHRRCEGEQ